MKPITGVLYRDKPQGLKRILIDKSIRGKRYSLKEFVELLKPIPTDERE